MGADRVVFCLFEAHTGATASDMHSREFPTTFLPRGQAQQIRVQDDSVTDVPEKQVSAGIKARRSFLGPLRSATQIRRKER
jgi:hypothetical protein